MDEHLQEMTPIRAEQGVECLQPSNKYIFEEKYLNFFFFF